MTSSKNEVVSITVSLSSTLVAPLLISLSSFNQFVTRINTARYDKMVAEAWEIYNRDQNDHEQYYSDSEHSVLAESEFDGMEDIMDRVEMAVDSGVHEPSDSEVQMAVDGRFKWL